MHTDETGLGRPPLKKFANFMAASRTKFYCFVIQLIQDVHVGYTLPDFPGNSSGGAGGNGAGGVTAEPEPGEGDGRGRRRPGSGLAKRVVQAVQAVQAPPVYGQSVMKQQLQQ